MHDLGISTENNNFIIGDINRDSRDDLIYFDVSGSATVWLSDGNGVFTTVVSPGIPQGDLATFSYHIADFDGDRRGDLLRHRYYAGTGVGEFDLMHSNGDGTFASPVRWSYPYNSADFHIADFNGDGSADMAHFDSTGRNATISLAASSSRTAAPFTIQTTFDTWSALPTYAQNDTDWIGAVGDFNDDGRADFAQQVADSYLIQWLGTDGANFQPRIVVPSFHRESDNTPYLTNDFNQDGKTDLLQRIDDDTLTVWLADTEAGFTTQTLEVAISADSFSQIARLASLGVGLIERLDSGYLRAYTGLGTGVLREHTLLEGNAQLWTTYTYDELGRMLTQRDPDNSLYSTEYDGLSTRVTNALGQQETRTYDSQGQLVSSIDNLGNEIRYEYDEFNNPTRIIAPGNIITTMEYDIRGNRILLNDPDTGITISEFDAFGQLFFQEDAAGNFVTYEYDRLGRMTKRNELEGETTWTYDTAANGKGQLAQVAAPDGYVEQYSYDELGRPQSSTITIDGTDYVSSQNYDGIGRLRTITYPTGFTIRNHYNSNGYLIAVTEAKTSELYWRADHVNARGQLEAQLFGNGVESFQKFDTLNGRLSTIQSGHNGKATIQNLTYQFDASGNLLQRADLRQNIAETFSYDSLNRLTNYNVSGQANKSVNYNDNGNIRSRSDVGIYLYEGNAPHAITRIIGASDNSYQYDENGNRISSDDGSISYTSYNKPDVIVNGANSVMFNYGADRSRYKQVKQGDTPQSTSTIVYVGGLYERETTALPDKVTHRHYIQASTGVIAVRTEIEGEDTTTRYLHRDHLGSVDTMTDEFGQVMERLSFDAWGQRRLANWQDAPLALLSSLSRGFTGHEHLDSVGLIHMNGRVYDPSIGRFLSADPFVQAPENTQSLNRYSYVVNNPLSNTDPSGFIFGSVFKFFKNIIKGIASVVKSIFKEVAKFIRQYGAAIVTIAVGIIAAPLGPVIAGALAGFAGGFVGTLLNGGDIGDAFKVGIKGAIQGAISGGAFSGVGTAIKTASQFVKVVAKGVTGGVLSIMRGGKFQHGFLSAATTQLFTPYVNAIDSSNASVSVQRTVAAAIVGGTASELSGGKFVNGAVTGAFSHMFSDGRRRAVDNQKRDAWLQSESGISGIQKGSSKSSVFYGNYVGPGNNGYHLAPVDRIDKLASIHARAYDNAGADGILGTFLNLNVAEADLALGFGAFASIGSNANIIGELFAVGAGVLFSTVGFSKATVNIVTLNRL